ncbi:MAG: PfkB family carbohydrate kinase [Candidatus Dojkabacteria bacterium]
MGKALVVGSLAFDVIFTIHGSIKDEIIVGENGDVADLSMMFTANGRKKFYGGTGGNIAYGLGLLNKKPQLFSVAGHDFVQDYSQHLKEAGVDLKVHIIKNQFTATFYGISDEKNHQIGIWQPDAYGDWIAKVPLSNQLSRKELEEVEIAIFPPGTGESTSNHMHEFRQVNKNAKVIFDPSQVMTIFYSPEKLKECLSYSDIFIGNETEVSQLKSHFGLEPKDLFALGLEAVIETKGANGSIVHLPEKKQEVEAVKADAVVETTGAGDAYRAGLISGMLEGKSLKESARIGAEVAAKSVAEYGGQMYKLD